MRRARRGRTALRRLAPVRSIGNTRSPPFPDHAGPTAVTVSCWSESITGKFAVARHPGVVPALVPVRVDRRDGADLVETLDLLRVSFQVAAFRLSTSCSSRRAPISTELTPGLWSSQLSATCGSMRRGPGRSPPGRRRSRTSLFVDGARDHPAAVDGYPGGRPRRDGISRSGSRQRAGSRSGCRCPGRARAAPARTRARGRPASSRPAARRTAPGARRSEMPSAFIRCQAE